MVQSFLVVNVSEHPVLAPSLGDEVEEGVDIREGQASRAFLVSHRGKEADGVSGGRWYVNLKREMEAEESVVLD
jgi:hypothetical protein